MTKEQTYRVTRGNEVDVLNIVSCIYGSLVYQMWIEIEGKKLDCTWTTRKRLDSETKKYFKI